jgi:hypothetical protein
MIQAFREESIVLFSALSPEIFTFKNSPADPGWINSVQGL